MIQERNRLNVGDRIVIVGITLIGALLMTLVAGYSPKTKEIDGVKYSLHAPWIPLFPSTLTVPNGPGIREITFTGTNHPRIEKVRFENPYAPERGLFFEYTPDSTSVGQYETRPGTDNNQKAISLGKIHGLADIVHDPNVQVPSLFSTDSVMRDAA